MEAMREAWTDERLDDLTNRMDRGFDRVDAQFEKLWRLMLVTFVTTLVGLFTAHF